MQHVSVAVANGLSHVCVWGPCRKAAAGVAARRERTPSVNQSLSAQFFLAGRTPAHATVSLGRVYTLEDDSADAITRAVER